MPSAKPLMPKAIFPSFDVEPSSIIAPPETQDISVPLSTLAAPKLAQATVAGEMGHLASLGLGARDANGVCHELSQSYLDQLAIHMMGNFRLPFYVKRPVILVYAFDQSGKLLRLERVKSSGSDRFDAYIMHHINQISPMPPIPASEHAVFYQDLLVVGFSKHARSKFIDDHCHKLNDDSRLDEGGGPVARGKE